jgi:hypothetical protein
MLSCQQISDELMHLRVTQQVIMTGIERSAWRQISLPYRAH